MRDDRIRVGHGEDAEPETHTSRRDDAWSGRGPRRHGADDTDYIGMAESRLTSHEVRVDPGVELEVRYMSPELGLVRVPLDHGCRVIVGRAVTCQITVHSSVVSREHVAITRTVRGVHLEDLASHNGTVLRQPVGPGAPLRLTLILADTSVWVEASPRRARSLGDPAGR